MPEGHGRGRNPGDGETGARQSCRDGPEGKRRRGDKSRERK